MEVKINCCFDAMVPVGDLKPHPKNRNKHPKDQIERLAKIIQYQGLRSPIKVSKQSGFITAGHGRLNACIDLGMTSVPVDYQDYESDEQEYADVQSDNSIASWSELDLATINLDLEQLGPEFDIELLGIENFVIEPLEKFEMEDELKEDMNKKYILEVTFPNDMELRDIHDDLASRGYIVKVKNK